MAIAHSEDRPILIPQIAGFLNWLEELITTSAGLLLSLVLAVTLASLLTGGTLLKATPWLGACYAWAQGIGIEGQLAGMTFRATKLWRSGKVWGALALSFVVVFLGLVSFVGAAVVNHQETFGTSTIDALQTLGIGKDDWDHIRAAVLVVLVILSAAMRYQPRVVMSLEEKRAKIAEEMEIKRLRQEARKADLLALVSTAKEAAKTLGSRDEADAIPEETPPPEQAIPAETRDEADAIPEETRREVLAKNAPLPRGMLDKDGLIAWAKTALNRDLGEDEAKTILKNTPGNTRLEWQQGRPIIAPSRQAKSIARRLYPPQKVRVLGENPDANREPIAVHS